MWRRWWG
jgi:hypothetical protein